MQTISVCGAIWSAWAISGPAATISLLSRRLVVALLWRSFLSAELKSVCASPVAKVLTTKAPLPCSILR